MRVERDGQEMQAVVSRGSVETELYRDLTLLYQPPDLR